MTPNLGSVEEGRTPRWLWFVATGTAAVLIGVIAVYVFHAPLWFTFLILPTSMLLFDPSPADLAKQIFQFSLSFGGTFVFYGIAGWFVGNAIQVIATKLGRSGRERSRRIM
jgi:hypothetical protein